MKKPSLLKISLCAFLVVISLDGVAQAKDGVYVGIDVLFANAKHKYLDKIHETDSMNGKSVDGDSFGFGLNAGYKISFDRFFVAPELFFDYLNNSTKDFYYTEDSNQKQNSMEINSRYGAKLNIGYNIVSKLNGFVNFGVANVDYDFRQPSWINSGYNTSYGASKLAPIYGVGFSYDLTENWTAKTSYDFQQFNARYVEQGFKDKVSLNVFKIGAVYSF